MVFGYGYDLLFTNVAFVEPISSTPLNGSLRNLSTWRVSAGSRNLEEILGIVPSPKMPRIVWSPQTCATKYAHCCDEMEICAPAAFALACPDACQYFWPQFSLRAVDEPIVLTLESQHNYHRNATPTSVDVRRVQKLNR